MRSIQLILTSFLALLILSCAEEEQTMADQLKQTLENTSSHMYVIERNIPGAGDLDASELKAISRSSCDVIDGIGSGNITWLHSYVTGEKVYCVYLAKNKAFIEEHAKKGGFPANTIEQVAIIIDPETALE